MSELSHVDRRGQASMVDVGGKAETLRTAEAVGRMQVNENIFRAIETNTSKKGDVLAAARIAGIQGAKHTWELIPLCHTLNLTQVTVDFSLLPETLEVECVCRVKCVGKTGAEMEALTGASTALLTVYDMCKALGQDMTIGPVFLRDKDGGKTGHYRREGQD